ncbi:MAG: hypothetical protein K0S80_4169, partial [Neobacillus sp.]|nr:hypothetical protein [Neobacillus sp.]
MTRHLFKIEHSVAKGDIFLTFRINHYIHHYFLENPIVTISEIKLHLINVMKWGYFFGLSTIENRSYGAEVSNHARWYGGRN